MNFRSLRARLFIFYSLLMVSVMLGSLYLMSSTADRMGEDYAKQNLDDAKVVVQHYFNAERAAWSQVGKLIVNDSPLLASITDGDKKLAKSQLARYQSDLNVDHMTIASGNVADQQSTRNFIRSKTGLYHQIMLPIDKAGKGTWLRIARKIDIKTAHELGAIANVKLSLISEHKQGIKLHGSSRDFQAKNNNAGNASIELLAELTALLNHEGFHQESTGVSSMVMPLGRAENSVFVILQSERNEIAESSLSQLHKFLALLFGFGILIAVHGGYVIAKNVSKQLKRLADYAKEIQLGNYAKTIEVNRSDEVGELAYTLNVMTQSIALREEEMMHMAYSDTLTNLPNRAMFNQRLSRMVSTVNRQPTPFTIMMIDLDRFKFINDVLGHEAGDLALKIVSKRLLEALRKSDTVARLGGDEFGIILPTADRRRIIDIANKIIRSLEEPIPMGDQHVDLGGSIGIASYPTHATEASELLRFSDVAMYEAKSSGSGYAFFDINSEAFAQTHLSLLGDIRKAVTANEFELYFQPKVGLLKSDTPNMEVLIRWNHPERGFIPPDEFIPFAESTGSVRLITHWVIDNAIAQAGRWHEAGTEVKISLNVSSRDLLNPQLSDIVSNALSKSKLPVEHLCLEITESALLDDPDKARDMVQSLHDMGIRLSIDDYGTGYSSLAYVANLPVDELKIDKVFVNNMLDSAEDSAIVRSTIELGHYLKMDVIAEGIEEHAELERLRLYGCDYAQGYLIAKPMCESEMLSWLKSGDWRNYAISDSSEAINEPAANDSANPLNKAANS